MSHYGHGYTKALPVLAARSALSRTDTDLSRRGHRLLMRGKDYNQAVCAVARKMFHIVWHVLNDHPIPNREGERCMCKKLEVMLSVLPKEEIRARGFKSCSAYAKSIVKDPTTPLRGTVPVKGSLSVPRYNQATDPALTVVSV